MLVRLSGVGWSGVGWGHRCMAGWAGSLSVITLYIWWKYTTVHIGPAAAVTILLVYRAHRICRARYQVYFLALTGNRCFPPN